MQKYIITFLILLICNLSLAQISSPQASPRSKIFQKVGLVDISIDYSRPSKKERKIFGNIVPYDEVWRTGANQATAISFSEDVKVNSKLLKAGEYFLYSIPDSEKNGLSLIFYEKNKNWGALKEIDENKVLLNVFSSFVTLPFTIETFTISINNISNNGATLDFAWDDQFISYNLDVMTTERMKKQIDNVMSNNPTKNDLSSAAVFFLEENIDIKQAMKWINLAYPDNKAHRYWQYRYKSLIYEKAGKMKKAIQYAKLGLDDAIKTGGPDGINTLNRLNDRLLSSK